MYRLVKRLSRKPSTNAYPEANDDAELADRFSEFFEAKIRKINDSLNVGDMDTCDPMNIALSQSQNTFDDFGRITTDELRKVIMESPSKSCALDPLPTPLLKLCVDELLPSISIIINKSLSSGYMPKQFKEAIIIPIPKKANIKELTNFRPISNLPFLSKVIERIVIDKLSEYCSVHGLEESLQSAYRKGHSCETALLRVMNDLLCNMDSQKVTLLTLLDMSAAFDTIPHDKFLERLESDYGISGNALSWFQSYFQDRFQAVRVNSSMSKSRPLTIGMPQGSGAGPWGYTKYTGPLGLLIRLLAIIFHMFADDTQLFSACKANDSSSQNEVRTKLENAICSIGKWMKINNLKLNSDKTEFMLVGTQKQLSKMEYNHITIEQQDIKTNPI